MTRRNQFSKEEGFHPQASRRSPLGWPAALFALSLLSIAGYNAWQAFSYSSIPHCGMPAAVAVIVGAFLVAIAIGVVCIDMLIRLMDR